MSPCSTPLAWWCQPRRRGSSDHPTKRFGSLAVPTIVLLVLALAGCGEGGGSGHSTATDSSGGTTPAAQPRPRPEPNADRDKFPRRASGEPKKAKEEPAMGGSGRATPITPLRVSDGGSAQFRVKGGDNSIQEYGKEAAEPELVQAAKALHLYLVARAGRDWPRACNYLASKQASQLKQLAASSPQIKGAGCAAALKALLVEASGPVARELTVVDAASLRTEGQQAFLLYRGAGHTAYFMSMAKQDGTWKVAGLDPSAFP
jgi:hypothetical protein